LGEAARRRDLPGHVGVIEMAVSIDQTRQEDRVPKIPDLLAPDFPGFRPASNPRQALVADPYGSILNRRTGNRHDDASAKEHEQK
jgi:hypothetical protein